ncbi:MAG: ABC transporter permease [Actinomycetota bacterium]|nr:ABC transporter permease [Actinomycetota bacterium]
MSGAPATVPLTERPSPAGEGRRRLGAAARGRLWAYGIWAVLALLVLVLVAVSPSFRTSTNLTNILEQNSMLGIVALGMLVMMVSGGFDLSVGAVGATSAVVGAYLSAHGGLWAAIPGALAVGLLVGLANGLLIARARINAFVTTFAMASVVTGIMFVATSASPINANAGWLVTLALDRIGGIPYAFIAYVLVALLTGFALSRTKWGHYVYAVGGNREASFLSGVPVVPTQLAAFIYGGLCAAIGGLILLGQSDIGQPSSATDWPLTAIAICVIGGVSLMGGEGRLHGTIAATFVLGVISNGLNLLNVSPYIQPTVTGAVILIAVALDRVSRRRQAAG